MGVNYYLKKLPSKERKEELIDVKKKVKLLIDIVLVIMRSMKKNVLNGVKDLIDIVKIITTITTKHILNV